MSMTSENAVMDPGQESKAAASLAGVRIERVLLDDDESRHLTKDDISHYRDTLSAPTETPTRARPPGGMDAAGMAGLVTLCVVAFAVVLLI